MFVDLCKTEEGPLLRILLDAKDENDEAQRFQRDVKLLMRTCYEVGLTRRLESAIDKALQQPALEESVRINPSTAPTAIPMRLPCPECGKLHIDEGEFATKLHHTHSCQHCGLTWRPAIVPTVGVRFLPGFKNNVPPEGT